MNFCASMLVPQTMTAVRLPCRRSASGPSSAAVAAAPAGSTASFIFGEEQTHGAAHGLVVDLHQLVHVTPAEPEGIGLGEGCAEAVGDGRHALDRLGRAGREAPMHGVGAFRLDAVDPAIRL